MRILYTGFKGKNNSSYELISRIFGEKLCLTNSFNGIKRDIERASGLYDLVIMFGLDKNLKNRVRIERLAECNVLVLTTKIDVEKIKDSFEENKIESILSDISTKYLCNEAYFHMLQKTEGKAVFIHIPSLKNMSDDWIEKVAHCMEEVEECVYFVK